MTMTRNSSLLAPEEDAEAPSLGAVHVDVEQSPLERLIAQSSIAPEQAFSLEDLTPRRSVAPFSGLPPRVTEAHTAATSLRTVFAGTFSLLQIGFTWSSFISASWFDTYLKVSIDWQQRFLPLLSSLTVTHLESTTLASILSTLNGAEQHGAFISLLITSLLMPCVFMILGPSWTIGDHNDRRLRRPQFCLEPRIMFELAWRVTFLLVFVLVVLDIGISFIELDAPSTDVSVLIQIRGGLIGYLLGVLCALACILVLRGSRKESLRIQDFQNETPASNSRVPPTAAFQLPWLRGSTDSQFQDQLQREPLLQEEEMATQQADFLDIRSQQRNLSFFKKIILYEVGGLAILLWFPALFLPLFRVRYDGLASQFMSQVELQVRLWEIPAVAWYRGAVAGTDRWILLMVASTLVTLVYVMPLLATIFCVAAWISQLSSRFFYKRVVKSIHPALCGIIFCGAVLLALPAMEPVTRYLLNEKTSGICQKFHLVTDDSCLTVSGQHSLGVWFLLTQSLSLELFVALTLQWIN